MNKFQYYMLNAVSILQERLELKTEGVQPKDILKELENKVSQQTAYTTLRDLVSIGFLTRKESGKFSFYKITPEGKKVLEKIKEMQHKEVTDPLVKSIANKIKEDYPEDFENVSYSVIVDYLNKEIKEFEAYTINCALKYFGVSKKDEKRDVA